ncbi:hypothetical protein FFLO_06453 [Filobasidium floriforme]|uniref:Signal peptidase complex catalytic subunit SEC11 n=1 Tax=Filobasidium floriforme TaxID=5210 RepID=A0A8K0JFD3_9TREE|nr:hypothetical protein FFLO_06453 [Filobasidium floriforme]
MFMDEINQLRRMGFRAILLQALNLATIIAGGLMGWKALCLATNSESPIVVVLSESMEPAFARGDILFLTNFASDSYEIGDIPVYKIPGANIPIVHRIIHSHTSTVTHPNGTTTETQLMLTKGDNNPTDDLGLYHSYMRGMKWLKRDMVVGKVRGFLPHVGYVTIVMNDYPQLKYALLGTLGVFLLFNKEQ